MRSIHDKWIVRLNGREVRPIIEQIAHEGSDPANMVRRSVDSALSTTRYRSCDRRDPMLTNTALAQRRAFKRLSK